MREQHVANDSLEEGYEAVAETAAENLEELRQRLEEADAQARAFVREHPIASVAIAAAAGFVIGRIAARYL
jgi:ElaB/YqjD/DUF883 family membrane-anchored ribosome-binding protein